jgi:transcriptional regulator with XRE-family HTH domain
MTALAQWLRRELDACQISQQAASVHAGVSQATLSDILNQGHIPRIETLFRLADYFGTRRDFVLRLAAGLPADEADEPEREYLVQELLAEFRLVPDEWKEVAIQHVRTVGRLARQPAYRVIGDDGDEGKREVERDGEAARAA